MGKFFSFSKQWRIVKNATIALTLSWKNSLFSGWRHRKPTGEPGRGRVPLTPHEGPACLGAQGGGRLPADPASAWRGSPFHIGRERRPSSDRQPGDDWTGLQTFMSTRGYRAGGRKKSCMLLLRTWRISWASCSRPGVAPPLQATGCSSSTCAGR